jgi:hypothetical protein
MFFWVTPSEVPRNKDDLWGIIQDKLFKLPHIAVAINSRYRTA